MSGIRSQPTIQNWTLLDPEGQPVHLEGRLLGRASSVKDGHNHDSEYAVKGTRCSACRWFEVMIFDVSMDADAGVAFLVYTCGKTIVPSEFDRPRFKWTDSPREAVECLIVRQNGEPRLPVASALALAQAADQDEDIADAYENRLVA